MKVWAIFHEINPRWEIWGKFSDLCMRIIRDPLTTLLLSFMCHAEQCVLNMHRIAAKFMHSLLTADQKELRAEICQDLHQYNMDDPTFMSRVITGDMTWATDMTRRPANSRCKSPTFPQPKMR